MVHLEHNWLMAGGPWWVHTVSQLLEPTELTSLELGTLWRLSENLKFVRDNVELALLSQDFSKSPSTFAVWERFLLREAQTHDALSISRDLVSHSVSHGELGPVAFRARWEALGFEANAQNSGTPADDYLDGLFAGGRSGPDAPLPELGNPNMGSRARQTADFLRVLEPSCTDVVFDLGSGSGKFALTISASCVCHVVGVELCADYVCESRSCACGLGLINARFEHADARDVDLSPGSIFYLYHPFRGTVASTVAEHLGALARLKDIRIFSAGPLLGYGEYFLREVEKGSLKLNERRGEFSEVMVLSSARVSGFP